MRSSGKLLQPLRTLLNVPKTEVTHLSNGFRVASESTDLETATVGIFIDAGSRYENSLTNGAAHFVEHMSFKGTEKRTQQQLELEIENMGAQLNAYTTREQTVYYARCFKKDIPQAVDILADILTSSKMETDAIDRERDTILREMKEVEKQTEEYVFDRLHQVCFQGNSLSRTILGPEGNIKKLTRADLKEYVDTHYVGPRMVMAAAGGVDHDQLVKLADAAFGKLPGVDAVKYGGMHSQLKGVPAYPTIKPARFIGSDYRERDDEKGETHFCIATEGVSWTDPDYFPLMIIQTLIGSWDRSLGGGEHLSSVLARKMAEQQLAHRYQAFSTCYSDTGLLGIYMVARDRHRLGTAVEETMHEWCRIALNITQADFARAKHQVKTSMLLYLDGSNNVCEDIGRQVLTLGRRMSPFEISERVDQVTLKNLQDVAYHYMYEKDLAVSSYGEVEGFPDLLYISNMSNRWAH